jgi:methylglutaconyl-CoA hydratase
MEPRAATEYFLTGEAFGAPRAAEIGLLTRAVPEAELDEQTARYVGLLLRGAPGALAATKTVLREAAALPVTEGLARMAMLSADRFASEEAQEGMAAFAEKRDPSWLTRP